MSKKQNNNTALTVSADINTIDALTLLDQRISNLKAVTESNYKTSGVIDGTPFAIKNETKVENLIKAFSVIIGKSEMYGKAAKALGRKTYPAFVVGGGNVEDWKHDIELRLAIIEHADELATLNSYKEKMSKFLSEADQKAQLLKEMADHFSK